MNTADVLAGLAVLVGLAGILVPVLPGSLLILAAVLVWAAVVAVPAAWVTAMVATLLLLVGAVVKYTVPGRRLQAAGVPNRTLVLGGLAGIVGFFVIPVVGLFAGFVAGVYAAEVRRIGRAAAWPSTRAALGAAGLSMLIELSAGLLAAAAFAVGVAIT